MGFKDAPQPADPLTTSGLEAAFNRPNQYTPFGNMIVTPPRLPTGTTSADLPNTPLGAIGQSSVQIQLPPAIQNILDTQTAVSQQALNQAYAAQQQLQNSNFQLPASIDQQAMLNQLPGALDPSSLQVPNALDMQSVQGMMPGAFDPSTLQQGQTLNANNLPYGQALDLSSLNFANPNIDFSSIRDEATASEFQRLRGLLDPELERRESQLREGLASRGIPVERQQGTGQTTLSNAGRGELGLFEDQRNRAIERAGLSAMGAGRQEAALALQGEQARFGQELAALQQQIGAQGQSFGQNAQNIQQYLGAQSQGFNQNALNQQQTMQGQGQAFGQGLQGLQTLLGAQGQSFGQGQQNLQAALGAQGQAFGQGQQNFQQQLGLQQTALQQELARQAFLQNQIASPLGQQQVQAPQLQNFFAPGQVDVGGNFAAANQAQQQGFMSQMEMLSGLFQGLGSLGGAAFIEDLNDAGTQYNLALTVVAGDSHQATHAAAAA